MPRVSLVVCVFGDREPLSRLLERCAECYDELLVIHDGPDFQDVASLVSDYGGRFFARPRTFSQEPHFPFAFGAATNDWILRLDSDEFPSPELRQWLKEFRQAAPPPDDVSGFQCKWPVWDGTKMVTRGWPNKRIFLFHRYRAQWIGVFEHGIIPEGRLVRLPLILCHQPTGRSHGLRNIFGKKRTQQARKNAARALLGSPLDHPRWRYDDQQWPAGWQQIKDHPILTAVRRLIFWPPRQAIAMLLAGDLPRPSAFAHAGVFNATLCFEYWRQRRHHRNSSHVPNSHSLS